MQFKVLSGRLDSTMKRMAIYGAILAKGCFLMHKTNVSRREFIKYVGVGVSTFSLGSCMSGWALLNRVGCQKINHLKKEDRSSNELG